MTRRSTSTSAFGVSRRESHDSRRFYDRFSAPDVSDDVEVSPEKAIDELIVGDARRMDEVADRSVALVVTSPPYFAGKEYEEALGERGVPATYLEYLDLLREVFAECVRKLEPGGRIAVNVANLGRRPYRSLSADVISILQDDLRLLLRGEIIWVKQRGASGSCAWGSFQKSTNPVLRDLTERVVIAAKGRFDRALTPKQRASVGLPSVSTMTREDFMEYTLDVWELPPESAARVGHPAPFPVELPSRLIEMYTYRGDLVLDPFAGAGTSAVAALRAGRHFAGYDLDESYVRLAERRVAEERARLTGAQSRLSLWPPDAQSTDGEIDATLLRRHPLGQAIAAGRSASDVAAALLAATGFQAITRNPRLSGGVRPTFAAQESADRWLFDLCGGFTTHRSGMSRSDVVWRAIARAAVLDQTEAGTLVVLTCGTAPKTGPAANALRSMTGISRPIRAVVDILDPGARAVLEDLRTSESPVTRANRSNR